MLICNKKKNALLFLLPCILFQKIAILDARALAQLSRLTLGNRSQERKIYQHN